MPITITLNVYNLNAPIKSQTDRMNLKRKKKDHVYTTYKRLTSDIMTHTNKVEEWKKILLSNKRKGGKKLTIYQKKWI